MMAFRKIDRYQTVSELIIDLERSRLAASVPSFADANLALNEPRVRDSLSTAAPTRLLNLSAGMPAEGILKTAQMNLWQLRFRNREGRLCRARASTELIQKRLRHGRLPRDIEVRRPSEDTFQPIERFPEFAALRPQPRKKLDAANPEAATPLGVRPSPKWALYLLGLGFAFGIAGSILALRWVGLVPF